MKLLPLLLFVVLLIRDSQSRLLTDCPSGMHHMPIHPKANTTTGCMLNSDMDKETASAIDVEWKLGMSASEQQVTVCTAGTVTFTWKGHHDVAEVATAAELDACDATSTTVLKTDTSSHDHSSHAHRRMAADMTTLTIKAGESPGKRFVLCSVAGHCGAGQKATVTTINCDDHDHFSSGHRSHIQLMPFLILFVAVLVELH